MTEWLQGGLFEINPTAAGIGVTVVVVLSLAYIIRRAVKR